MLDLLKRLAERVHSGRPLYDMARPPGSQRPLSPEEEAALLASLREFIESVPPSVRAEAEADPPVVPASADESKLYPPATAEEIAAAEAKLGFALPPLLRDIYTQIGNGGFGPGYGLLGVEGGATDDEDRSIEQVYASFRRTLPGLPSPWPERLLPICYQGCGIYDCLDCSGSGGQIYYFDPNIPGDGPHGHVLEPHFGSLEEWIDQWIRVDDPFKRLSTMVDFGGKPPRTWRDTSALVGERIRRRELGPKGYQIQRVGTYETRRCECCGRISRAVWGAVRYEKEYRAVYFVHWTIGHVADQGANFDLILGKWGDGTHASDRQAASLDYRLLESGPAFMVIDSSMRDIAKNELVGGALNRMDVVGRPIADLVFAVADTVLAQDERIEELVAISSIWKSSSRH